MLCKEQIRKFDWMTFKKNQQNAQDWIHKYIGSSGYIMNIREKYVEQASKNGEIKFRRYFDDLRTHIRKHDLRAPEKRDKTIFFIIQSGLHKEIFIIHLPASLLQGVLTVSSSCIVLFFP